MSSKKVTNGKQKTFTLNLESIDFLVTELSSNGVEEMFNRLRSRALLLMDDSEIVDVDRAFLDISEIFLKKARDEKDNEEAKLFYTLSNICRRIAYEIHRKYLKRGPANEDKDSKFIRLVVDNKNAPMMV